MLLPLLMNLNMFTAALDKGRDAGSGGSKQWWQQDEIVIPGVTHYARKAKQQITPLKPQLEEAKKKIASARQFNVNKEETARLQRQLGTLTRSVNALERRAVDVAKAKNVEKAVNETVAKYTELRTKVIDIEQAIAALDAQIEDKKRRIMKDDEEVIKLIMEVI